MTYRQLALVLLRKVNPKLKLKKVLPHQLRHQRQIRIQSHTLPIAYKPSAKLKHQLQKLTPQNLVLFPSWVRRKQY